jgi:hypothetical protein
MEDGVQPRFRITPCETEAERDRLVTSCPMVDLQLTRFEAHMNKRLEYAREDRAVEWWPLPSEITDPAAREEWSLVPWSPVDADWYGDGKWDGWSLVGTVEEDEQDGVYVPEWHEGVDSDVSADEEDLEWLLEQDVEEEESPGGRQRTGSEDEDVDVSG